MKTFKLTKKFLGSPALNTVITEKELEEYLQSANMEEILEYWTEVPERDYLILTLLCNKSGKRYIYNSTFDIYVNENFSDSRRGFPAHLVEEFVGKGFYKIESVRLKDSPKVFKIGDRIINKECITAWKDCFIKDLLLTDYSQILIVIRQEGSTGTYTLSNTFRVLKSIRTADDVKVYEGDDLWFITTGDWTYKKFDWLGIPSADPKFIWVSTEKIAMETVALNKPVLMSAADVMSCTTHTTEAFRTNLFNLVKSKA